MLRELKWKPILSILFFSIYFFTHFPVYFNVFSFLVKKNKGWILDLIESIVEKLNGNLKKRCDYGQKQHYCCLKPQIIFCSDSSVKCTNMRIFISKLWVDSDYKPIPFYSSFLFLSFHFLASTFNMLTSMDGF